MCFPSIPILEPYWILFYIVIDKELLWFGFSHTNLGWWPAPVRLRLLTNATQKTYLFEIFPMFNDCITNLGKSTSGFVGWPYLNNLFKGSVINYIYWLLFTTTRSFANIEHPDRPKHSLQTIFRLYNLFVQVYEEVSESRLLTSMTT